MFVVPQLMIPPLIIPRKPSFRLKTKPRAKALQLSGNYEQQPILVTDWPQLLKISIESGNVSMGLAIHAFLIKLGTSTSNDPFQANNLINMYVKFNKLTDARRVFDEMSTRNTISWTSLMTGYSQLNDFLSVLHIAQDMGGSGESFNEHTCTVVLHACACAYSSEAATAGRVLGEQVHGLAVKMDFHKKVFVATSLISMYSKCGSFDDAERVFKGVDQFDIRCFNSIILGYGKQGNGAKAMEAFRDFLTSGLEPNDYTFTNVISACTNGEDNLGLERGKLLHCLAIKFGCVRDISVGNATITMYGKYGFIEEAVRMFDGMGTTNLVSWTALLSGCAKHGKGEMAASIFIQMLHLSLAFDSRCLATVIEACSQYEDFRFGLQIHGLVMKLGYVSDDLVGTAVIDNYVKLGYLPSARLVYDTLSDRNLASLNALLPGYIKEVKEDALALFNELRYSGIEPDSVTFARLLSVYASQSYMVKGRILHAYIVKLGLDSELIVSNGLITMYSKCGSIEDACQVFYNATRCDLVSWNAMISGYALNGQGEEALFLFQNMERQGFLPDKITILAVLQACSYSGLFEEGFCLFEIMESRYGITPVIEHYSSMVDLLGRARNLSKAMDFIIGSPFPESTMLWRTLVNACKLHGDLKFGVLASKHLLELVPEDAASYVLVSNMYAQVRMLPEAAKARTMISNKQLNKEAGCSWIEIKNQVHRFVANDKDHSCCMEIYTRLVQLTAELKTCDTTQLTLERLGMHCTSNI